ncbi:hypothetical protein [Nocardia camponoti]|uniref:hypothetical protein n=1 Tax=Nocardia camponoti TaxID=1616106 RepID=UPI0016645782|nr:hypothetical protein [Nocardia camponoti]
MSRFARPLAVVAAAFAVTALGAGTAAAATPSATPIVGSATICTSIPVGPVSISICI